MPKTKRLSSVAKVAKIAKVAKTPRIDLTDSQYYFNRELSWLEFNSRILHEAFDPRTPLLERLSFMAIFCANLDEFFMVRVGLLKRQMLEQQMQAGSLSGPPDYPSAESTVEEQLTAIAERLRPMVAQHHRHFEQAMRPQLASQGIHLLDATHLNSEQQQYLQQYFEDNIFPILTPLAIDPSHPFPYISNLSLNLVVTLQDQDWDAPQVARVKVPALLPRFVPLPLASLKRRTVRWVGVPVEQVIAQNLGRLFPGLTIVEHHYFRVTRNAELELEEEQEDLLQAVEQELRRRRTGATAVRLEIQASASAHLRSTLIQELSLTEQDVYDIDGLACLRDLNNLVALPLPDLKYSPWTPVTPACLRPSYPPWRSHGSLFQFPYWEEDAVQSRREPEPETHDLFSLIRQSDRLLHYPYDSFATSLQRFIEQAAHDPAVLAIKMTLYRTSTDSPILQTLITAAENGKQVAVLVELQASFDEANNIRWARRLEQAGVHVVYGLPGLKTHAKVMLVVRQEGEDLRRYVHIGTGDYNPRTAQLYTDVGLLSCREALGADLSALFNYLTGYSRRSQYQQLAVAPINLRQRLLSLIQREAEAARAGVSARIVAKVGALVDPDLIKALYEASQAGVKIDLIIQSICCLRPGVAGVSDRINVISLVGRFLEHSRIFYFHNRGAAETYISSADWMPRCLDRRVDVIAPVQDPNLAQDLQEILGTLLADNRHVWELRPTGRYVQRRPGSSRSEINAQKIFMAAASASLTNQRN
ncbi:MAG: polyphosphate kinase 1 [Elainella sp.]